MQFGSEDAYLAEVRQRLSRAGWPREIAAALAVETSVLLEGAGPRDQLAAMPLPGSGGRWVVSDDHFTFLEAFTRGTLPLLPMLVGPASPVAAAGTAVVILGALIPMAHKAWRKGVHLDRVQYLVWGTLRARGPCTVAELAAALADAEQDPVLWTEDRVAEELAGLHRVRLRDGSAQAFVQQDGSRWVAVS